MIGLVSLNSRTAGITGLEEELLDHLGRYLKVPFKLVHSGPIHELQSIPEEVQGLRRLLSEEAAPVVMEPKGDGAIDIALQYIRANFHSDLSLEKVASVVYLNAAYFSQLFKQKAGMGYKEYVTQLRMERAKELLQSTA